MAFSLISRKFKLLYANAYNFNICKLFSVNCVPQKLKLVPSQRGSCISGQSKTRRFCVLPSASSYATQNFSLQLSRSTHVSCGSSPLLCKCSTSNGLDARSTLLSSMPVIGAQTRYKHSKDKVGKGGKGKAIIHLTSEELNSVINEKQLLFELNEAVEEYKNDLIKSVSIRTNIGNLEELPVELEGDTFPLNELAQIHRKSAHLLIIECAAFPQATKTIMDTIKDSGMNLNPQQEGTKIAVPIPKVTREHREGLASKAKVLCNRCKESLRKVHSNYVRKANSKEGQVSSDLLFKVTQKIKELMDDRIKAADDLLAAKQAELLKV